MTDKSHEITPQSVIYKHIDNSCDLLMKHPDTVVGHLNHERSVTNDYRGRVLFELLQNAVDRAKKNIWIDFDRDKRTLIVANDGQPFAFKAREDEPRSDFAAICAIDTSNKAMGKSIGNKGVGFKSVWSLTESVQVRTREGLHQWGFRLRWPFHSGFLDSWSDEQQVAKIKQCLFDAQLEERHRGRAPSFYFPEFIGSPEWQFGSAVTAIELEELSDVACDQIEELINGENALLSRPLIFVSEIQEEISLDLTVRSSHLAEGEVSQSLHINDNWLRIDVDLSDVGEELEKGLAQLGVALGRLPTLILALPRLGKSQGFVHCYLPTDKKSGCPVELHGDFYLEESRKSVDFTNITYNKRLLELASDALIDALLISPEQFAHLPYALNLFEERSIFYDRIKERFSSNINEFISLLKVISDHQTIKTERWFDQLYSLINLFMPIKGHRRHGDLYNLNAVKPFFTALSKSGLPLIPVDFQERDEDLAGKTSLKTIDRIVLRAEPWPDLVINEKGKPEFSGRVFLKTKSSAIEVSVPGIVITDWQLPNPNRGLASKLKDFGLFPSFDTINVLREIRKAQGRVRTDHEKSNLLKVANEIYAPSSITPHTNWRFFIEGLSVYPSQLLELPTQCGRWVEARSVVSAGSDEVLIDSLDNEQFYLLDEDKCRDTLGDSWRSIVLYWGCWSCLPLIKNNTQYTDNNLQRWQLACNEDKKHLLTKDLIFKSWKVWRQGKDHYQNMEALYEELKDIKFIPSSGFEKIAPKDVFINNSNTDVRGFHVVIPGQDFELYQHLSVDVLSETEEVAKLVRLAKRLFPSTATSAQIKNPALMIYRNIIRQLNRCIGDRTDPILQELPLLYELKGGQRGVLQVGDVAWYIPSHYRSMRNKFTSDEHKVWFITGDVGTLANKLKSVRSLSIRPKAMKVDGVFDSEFAKELNKRYLPLFLALSNYSDSEGNLGVDEVALEKRWGTLEVIRTSHAALEELTSDSHGNEKSIVTDISDQGILWQPTYTDASKGLKVYVWDKFDINLHKPAFCRWFAYDVFRQKELAVRFERVIDDNQADGISLAMVDDARSLIASWLNDDLLKALVIYLKASVSEDVNVHNWKDSSLYQHHGIQYQILLEHAPSSLQSVLKFLDPKTKNLTLVEDYLTSVEENLAALKEPHLKTRKEWLDSFKASVFYDSFDVNPESWLLSELGMNKSDFDLLQTKIAYALAQLQKEQNVIHVAGHATAKVVNFGVKPPLERKPSVIPSSNVRLVPTQTDNERMAKQLVKSKSGKSVEEQYALLRAKQVQVLSAEDKSHFLELLRTEYKRLGLERNSYIQPLLVMPESNLSEINWFKLMYLGESWDGAGYDVFDYDANENQLLLIEVKSSKIDPPKIYLSENERKQALHLISESFTSIFRSTKWRLHLVIRDGKVADITSPVINILQLHDQSLLNNPHIFAESWIVSGLDIDKQLCETYGGDVSLSEAVAVE
jgi:hypothetical protein